MSTPTLDRPVVGAPSTPPATPSRARSRPSWRRPLLFVVLAAALAAAIALTGMRDLATSGHERVAIDFGDDPYAVQSDWGNLEVYGVEGSWIVVYDHEGSTTMRVPWDGGEVASARLGEDPIHLMTVAAVEQTGDALLLEITIGNCRYFHERQLDIFTGVHVQERSGREAFVPFDRPVLMHSPMLTGCPDRTLDRGDDVRPSSGG